MIKVWALQGIDGEIHAVSVDREPLDKYVAQDPLGGLSSVVEIDYNDDPITERGEAIQEELKVILKDVRKLHINKQAGFYAMSIDDRLEYLKMVFTTPGESFSFNDYRWKESDDSGN